MRCSYICVCMCLIGCDSSVPVEKELIGEFDPTFGCFWMRSWQWPPYCNHAENILITHLSKPCDTLCSCACVYVCGHACCTCVFVPPSSRWRKTVNYDHMFWLISLKLTETCLQWKCVSDHSPCITSKNLIKHLAFEYILVCLFKQNVFSAQEKM